MVFKTNLEEKCTIWKSSSVPFPNRTVDTYIGTWRKKFLLCREQIGADLLIGRFITPSFVIFRVTFAVNGSTVARENCSVLTVSPTCTLAWVPHTAGSILPENAVPCGHLASVGPTYCARIWTPRKWLTFGCYPAGYGVAYYAYARTYAQQLYGHARWTPHVPDHKGTNPWRKHTRPFPNKQRVAGKQSPSNPRYLRPFCCPGGKSSTHQHGQTKATTDSYVEQNETRGFWSIQKIHERGMGVNIRWDKTRLCWHSLELAHIQTGRGHQKYVPHRAAGKKDRHPWLSRKLKQMLKQEKKLQSKVKSYRSRNNISKLKNLQHRIQKSFRQEYWAYIENIICPTQASQNDKEHRDKNKRFWTYIKHNKQDSIGVASLRDPETDRLETDQTAKARILNKQFQSVFSPRMPSKLTTLCADATKPCYPKMPEFTISTNGLLKLLATLKPNKAAGPDDIRPYVLRDLREEIAPALQAIFTRTYETGRLPEQWKEANVVPIFKKGSKHKASNYRPVSLTCVGSKMFEHIMVSQINRHLKERGILIPEQHGFREGLSCDTQLIDFDHDLHTMLSAHKQVDCIVMDFSKAFDKVSHGRLLTKLNRYGIRGKNLNWIEDFLRDRSQRVVVEGSSSDSIPVTSGVPQGSVLGPILFLLFINDIGADISSNIRLFADDTIIYRAVDVPRDADRLQEDLNRLEEWSHSNQMEFHPYKCKHLMVTRARTPTISNYTIYGTTLEMVHKYLGVTFAKDLRWKTQWGNVRNASCATLRFLHRNLRVTSAATKTLAYTTFVRPQAEYACPVWSPHTVHDTHQIEMIQRTAARWVLARHERRASVTDMLAELKWRSLEQRRADIALTMLYKIHNAHVQITPSHLTPVTGIAASAHPHHYVQYHTDTVAQYSSFYPRAVRMWNALPAGVALAPSTDAFKHRVGQVCHRTR